MQNEESVSGLTYFRMKELPFNAKSAGADEISVHKKILVFSVETDTRKLLKTLLELWGYQIEVSENPEKSLSVIEVQKPALIIMDSILPFENHLESIRQIRNTEFSKEIPIIVISGFSQPKFKDLSIAVGATVFLVKPLDFDLFEKCLRRYLQPQIGKEH